VKMNDKKSSTSSGSSSSELETKPNIPQTKVIQEKKTKGAISNTQNKGTLSIANKVVAESSSTSSSSEEMTNLNGDKIVAQIKGTATQNKNVNVAQTKVKVASQNKGIVTQTKGIKNTQMKGTATQTVANKIESSSSSSSSSSEKKGIDILNLNKNVGNTLANVPQKKRKLKKKRKKF